MFKKVKSILLLKRTDFFINQFNIKPIEFDLPALASTAVYCKPSQASARVSVPFNADECVKLRSEIKEELHARDAVLVAHYYVDSELQDLAEKAGVYPMRDSPRLFLKPANG